MTPEEMPRPTTKSKQRGLLRVCIDTLNQDVRVVVMHAAVLKQLEEIYRQLRNRTSPRAPNTSDTMTPQMARDIRRFHAANPDLTYHEIAVKFNVQIGRISEAIRGKRL